MQENSWINYTISSTVTKENVNLVTYTNQNWKGRTGMFSHNLMEAYLCVCKHTKTIGLTEALIWWLWKLREYEIARPNIWVDWNIGPYFFNSNKRMSPGLRPGIWKCWIQLELQLWMPWPEDSILQHLLKPEASPEGDVKRYQQCLFKGPVNLTKYLKIHFKSFKTVDA